jgi:hypothetical protein
MSRRENIAAIACPILGIPFQSAGLLYGVSSYIVGEVHESGQGFCHTVVARDVHYSQDKSFYLTGRKL